MCNFHTVQGCFSSLDRQPDRQYLQLIILRRIWYRTPELIDFPNKIISLATVSVVPLPSAAGLSFPVPSRPASCEKSEIVMTFLYCLDLYMEVTLEIYIREFQRRKGKGTCLTFVCR